MNVVSNACIHPRVHWCWIARVADCWRCDRASHKWREQEFQYQAQAGHEQDDQFICRSGITGAPYVKNYYPRHSDTLERVDCRSAIILICMMPAGISGGPRLDDLLPASLVTYSLAYFPCVLSADVGAVNCGLCHSELKIWWWLTFKWIVVLSHYLYILWILFFCLRSLNRSVS